MPTLCSSWCARMPDPIGAVASDTSVEPHTLPPLTDDELCALALAADVDAPLDDDAVMLSEVLEPGAARLLPEWYMPAPMGGGPLLRGWRRQVVLTVIAAFVTITAYGLCNTYGQLHGG